jgi:uncharacterized damage-inducible protein DinB
MIKPSVLCAFVFLTLASAAPGKSPVPGKPAARLSPLAEAIDREISSLEKQFVAVAEAMPPEKFDATPESMGLNGAAFKGVRSFGAQAKHVAADNFAIWAPVGGEPEKAGINAPNGPTEMKSREEILKFLKDSFEYSHKAVAGLTSENQLGLVKFRGREVTRMSLVILALTHATDHYGQLVEYLRMNGVIPPGSR